jgi:hypothetical protein
MEHVSRAPGGRRQLAVWRARNVVRLQRGRLLWLLLISLDLLLFVPGYLFSQPPAHFLPYFPHAHALGSRAYGYLLALCLRRDNQDIFRVSVEFAGLLLCLVWTARSRFRGVLCHVAAALYCLLLLFLGYHQAMSYYFARPPALFEDIQLSRNLVHFIGALAPLVWLAWSLGVLFFVGLYATARFGFRALQARAAHWSLQRMLRLSVCAIALSSASLAWFGVQRDDPLLQLTGKRIADNVRASRRAARVKHELRDGPPDRRYDAFSQIALRRRPDFYLLMIEAYGEILATWDMRDAYRALLARVQQRLEAVGFHAATSYSASPVHGGTSWLSIATVHTGIWIDRPLAYSALENVGASIPSLTRFFSERGYRTHTLQPGTADHSGLHRFDLYNHDVVVDADTLGYHGPQYGWGRIPDQYSLGLFRERFWSHAPEPRYVFYMSVSTHWPWGAGVPGYVADWRTLNRSDPQPAPPDARWPAFPEAQNIGSALRRSYFQSVDYEFRLLTEWLESEAARDSVIVIIGDHQPRLEADTPSARTMNTPIHVLAQDPALIAKLIEQGFQPGMYADPTRAPPLRHSALFSLLTSTLAARDGAAAVSGVRVYPDGVRLSALNR